MPMQIYLTRTLVFVVTAISLIHSIALEGADRPNVVWIIADDFSPDLGCYGYRGVKTPNIDRLASSGTRYTGAFATAPVCSSSRSAFITGVYQTTTGTHQHRTPNKKPLQAPIVPITELLRNAGYYVCNANSTMKRAGKGDYNFSTNTAMYDGVDWAIKPGGRKKDQPFFAQIQIHEPHRNFVKSKNRERFKNTRIPPYYPEHPVIRADWADYLETVEELDRKVGRVLDRLQRENLRENTVVFFFGDHGRPHYRDKQWLYDGCIQVPLLVSWPGKVKSGAVRSSLVSLIDVSAATLALAGVEIPSWMQGKNMMHPKFQGRKMIFAARDRCGSTLDRIRCVRTKQYKYIRNYYPDRPYSQHSGYKVLQYPGITVAKAMHREGKLSGPAAEFWKATRPAEELYDLSQDPEELRNIAHLKSVKDVLVQLRRELDTWERRTDDQGRLPEADEKAAVESSNRWYQGRMKKRGLSTDIKPEEYLQWWKREFGLK